MCGSSCVFVPDREQGRVMDFAMKAPVILDLPKCRNVPRNFIRTVTFTQCNKCICDAPELGAGTLPNQWGQKWLFLQACVFPMEVSYHLYCDVFFGMRDDKRRGQWYVLSMTCAAGPEVLLVKMVAFESSTLL